MKILSATNVTPIVSFVPAETWETVSFPMKVWDTMLRPKSSNPAQADALTAQTLPPANATPDALLDTMLKIKTLMEKSLAQSAQTTANLVAKPTITLSSNGMCSAICVRTHGLSM